MQTRPDSAISRADLAPIVSLLAVSLLLGTIGLDWGVPNGDTTWAPDAITPMAPLSVANRLLRGGFNSGWFWYKYPLGHPWLLAVLYAPYMLWLKLSGGFSRPQTDYPFGFTHPDHALSMLALIGRGASVMLTAGAVVLWYLTCRELLGRRAAWFAAWFTATLFPVVYYAHTTNVDGPMTCWIVLALYGAARVYARGGDRWGMILFGVASAVAVSTKEPAIGAIVVVPVLLLVEHWQQRRREPGHGMLPAGAMTGVAAAVLLFLVLNAVFINPLGMWHRILFLMHTLPDALRQRYAPHFHPVGGMGWRGLATGFVHLRMNVDVLAVSMGWPILAAAAAGVGLWGWRRPGLFFAVPMASFYLLSVRTLETARPRFVLPIAVLATAGAGMTLDALWLRRRSGASRALVMTLVVACLVLGALRGAEAARYLVTDPRYAAEQWLQANVPPNAKIEVYQPETYLPRFASAMAATRIAFSDTTIQGFVQRQPDAVVLSSAGLAGVTSKYNPFGEVPEGDDEGGVVVAGRGVGGTALSFEYAPNRLFLDALQRGCLGYAPAAKFEAPVWVVPPIINGLAPEITVYRRDEQGSTPATDECRALLAGAAAEGEPGDR